ncbi:MAG: WcbI family polysaccharide biosynthesis putative acetyltransferase, partial [Cyanobacteriota bacterium]|nr:WcbI family polysaccharide biosynthesis putative acetyltransferase [Cyanobacteriota bacterium]
MKSNLHVAIAGNCQVEVLASWLKQSLPDAHVETLAPYHLLQSNQQVEDWLTSCDSADVVLAMPVKTGFRNFDSLGIEIFKMRMGGRLHCFPNLHSDAFFPFFGYAKN